MITDITYKLQGNGVDSWIIEFDDAIPEIVYKDPGTVAVRNEFLLYKERRSDGLDAYLMLISEFVLSPNDRTTNQFLEQKLEPVRDEIVNGQWISAREQLELINPVGLFTQELYDKIHLSLTIYITNNY